MHVDKFFTEHLHVDSNFLAGIVSIDIVGHSQLHGGTQQLANTKAALKDLVDSEVVRERAAALLPWRGDGGEVVFDVSDSCDEMIAFADRVRHLIPFFNKSRGKLNKLPDQQEIIVRIVCHCGELFNKGSAAELAGEALNILAHDGKYVDSPGHVVVSADVHRRLSDTLQRRLLPHIQRPPFGQTYVLDKMALTAIECDDVASNRLRDWITAKLAHGDYNQLLYFAYTNERLRDFLSFELRGVEIKILVRNWLVERADEQKFNEAVVRDNSDERVLNRRPWLKSKIIKARAKELIENEHLHNRLQSVNMRFYNGPPVFKGAILIDNSGRAAGRLGFCHWVEAPDIGGSPYKLDEWPALILDGRDAIQAKFLQYVRSRFDELWSKGLTYEEVFRREQSHEDTQPSVLGRVWVLDGTPYLIVYPQRHVLTRSFPMVAHEDAMAIREFDALLKSHGIESKLLGIQLPEELEGDWFPKGAAEEISNWRGHVIFVCTKSLPPAFSDQLRECGFPYEFHRIGSSTPFLRNLVDRHDWHSPTDWDPPHNRDFSVVAKLRRDGVGQMAYIVAGIRAIGTWGAASFLTNGKNVRQLGVESNQQFAAVVETSFDQQTFQIIDSKLKTTPILI